MKQLSRDFKEYEKRLEQVEAEKEQKIRECWDATNRANRLKENLKNIPKLRAENKRLKMNNRKVLEHARRMLGYAKIVSGAIQL